MNKIKHKIFYSDNNNLIFGIENPFSGEDLDIIQNIFKKVDYSKNSDLKLSYKIKDFSDFNKYINNEIVSKLFWDFFSDNQNLFRFLKKMYFSLHNKRISFSKNPLLYKINDLCNLNISFVKKRFEISKIKNSGFILPHTDISRKLVSLLVYLPTQSQNDNSTFEGTSFYKVKNEENQSLYSNFNNEIMFGYEDIEKFDNIFDKIITLPFDKKYIYGFCKSAYSWHDVRKINCSSNESRNSININYMAHEY